MAKKKTQLPQSTPITGKPRPDFGPSFKFKKRLTTDEEFQILKMVLDKVLWLGFGIMALGLWELYTTLDRNPFILMFMGAMILVIFIVIIIKEYEVIKR